MQCRLCCGDPGPDSMLIRRRYLIRRDFDNRTLVHLLRIEHIIAHGEENDNARNQARPIHMRRVRINRCREEAENDDDGTIDDRPGVE